MDAFVSPLHELGSFEELERASAEEGTVLSATGCMDAQKPHMMYGWNNGRGMRVIVTFNEQKARELLDAYLYFDRKAVYFPAKDILFYQSDIRGNALTQERIQAFRTLFEEKDAAIITTFDALLDRLVRPEVLRGFLLRLKNEDTVDLEVLRRRLVGLGYESVYQVETPGEFAIRGGIVDIFALTEELPYRIELWGDEVDSIRTFDPDSQRSVDTMEEIVVYPAAELVLTREQKSTGLDRIVKEGKKNHRTFPKGDENPRSTPVTGGGRFAERAGGGTWKPQGGRELSDVFLSGYCGISGVCLPLCRGTGAEIADLYR